MLPPIPIDPPEAAIERLANDHCLSPKDAQALYPVAANLDPTGHLLREAGRAADFGLHPLAIRDALLYCEGNTAEAMRAWIATVRTRGNR